MPTGPPIPLSPSQSPRPLDATAPRISWPSAPMFQIFMRNATTAARPVRMSGVARTSVPVSASLPPKPFLAISV